MTQDGHDIGQEQRTEEAMPTVSAEGVSTSEEPDTWFVAIVKRNSEKACRDELISKGLTAYVATQTIMRHYAKRKPKPVEYVRIPAKVFIRMFPLYGEKNRAMFFKEHPMITSFMLDYARSRRDWAVIPDVQMKEMQDILGDTENEVTFGYPDASYTIGEKVRAVGGAIHGLEGFIASREGKNYFCVEIKGLDWAKVCISKERLMSIGK